MGIFQKKSPSKLTQNQNFLIFLFYQELNDFMENKHRNPFDIEDVNERKKQHQINKLFIVKQKSILKDLKNDWKDGKKVVMKLFDYMENVEGMLNNAAKWVELVLSPYFNINDRQCLDQDRHFVMKNRFYGANTELHIREANELCKKITGQTLEEIYESMK